jgi:hypothetical protein
MIDARTNVHISFENGILMCTVENMIFLWDSKYTLVSTNVYIGSLMYTLVLPMYTLVRCPDWYQRRSD